jgi:hypothetical protein
MPSLADPNLPGQYAYSFSPPPGKLESVYRRRQPGFEGCNSHPILRKRQQQRSDLHRSASLVLAPPTQAPAAELPGIVEATALFNQIPARLESCRQRLLAAEVELERVHLQGNSELFAASGTSAPVANADRPSSSGELASEPPVVSEENADADSDVESWSGPDSGGSGGIPVQLAAVEDRLVALGSKWWNLEQDRTNMVRLRDELSTELAASKAREEALIAQLQALVHRQHSLETDAKTLRTNLGVSEAQTQVLTKKLGVSEKEAKDLQAQLITAGSRENILHTQVTSLHSQLYASQSDAEDLRHRLGMAKLSKEALADFKRQVEETHAREVEKKNDHIATLQSTAQNREEVLQSQVTDLQSQLYTSKSEAEDLRHQLGSAELGQEALAERLQSAEQRSAAAAQECTALKQLLQRSEHEALKNAEAAKQSTANIQTKSVDAPQAATAPMGMKKASIGEAQFVEELAERERVYQRVIAQQVVSAVVVRTMAKLFGEPDVSAEGTNSRSFDDPAERFQNVAHIPELLFISDLGPIGTYADAADEDDEAYASRKPAKCQIDLDLHELRIQVLRPAGPSRKIKLHDVVSAERPDSSDATIDLELESSNTDSKGPYRLRIAAADEAAVHTLLGAISVTTRVAPGSDMQTLTPSTTPRGSDGGGS